MRVWEVGWLGAQVAVGAIAAVNLATAPRLPRARPRRRPRVSLLVPARNERAHLRRHLPTWQRQRGAAVEILVLDDGSTDGTLALVAHAARRDPRLRVLTGAPLPPGWVGKNWACAQLARAARGEWLVFVDADVAAAPMALARTLAAAERWGADVVTALPRNVGPWPVRAVTTAVAQLPLLLALPLALVPRRPEPSLAAGNGQWFAWRREAYEAVGGHAAVAGEVLEDVALARRAKRAGRRLLVVLAPDDLRVRAYPTLRAAWQGFMKNLYPLLGGRPWAFAMLWLLVATAELGPWLALPRPSAAAAVLVQLLVRGAAFVALGQPPWLALVYPAAVAWGLAAAASSAAAHARRAVRWKDRPVPARAR